MKCWAYHAESRLRCVAEEAHEQHVFTWTDDECLDLSAITVDPTPIHTETLIDSAYPAAGVVGPVKCFSCGCPESEHLIEQEGGDIMCSKHQCRVFIP